MLKENISDFLTTNGFEHTLVDICGKNLIKVCTGSNGKERFIMPVNVHAVSMEESEMQSEDIKKSLITICENLGQRPIMIVEDRWHAQQDMMKARLLAHLEIFHPIYARNCEVRKIDKTTAADFLKTNHSYGDAACKYRYGLFLKRHTGWRSVGSDGNLREAISPGTLIAVAEFSNARKWIKGDLTIRSYEWTRYASLAGVRINGGMGKMLTHFIKEIQPDDIMSYADLEWSEGSVYEQLGFSLEGQKEPVSFIVDCRSWLRTAIGKRLPDENDKAIDQKEEFRYFRNFGSNKYRLKLTEYH